MTQKQLKDELAYLLKEREKLDERIKNCKKYITFKPKKYDLDKIRWWDVPHGLYEIKFKKTSIKDKDYRFKNYLHSKFVEIGDYEDDYNYSRYDYFVFKDQTEKRILNSFERENLNGCIILTLENKYYHKSA